MRKASADAPKQVQIFHWLPAAVILCLATGLATGAALRPHVAEPVVAMLIEICDIAGTMWVNAIRMTVIPLIVPLLIASIAGAQSGRSVGRMGLVTVGLFYGLLVGVVAISAVLAPIAFNDLKIDPADAALLRSTAIATTVPAGDAGLGAWLKTLIPTNPIKAAADGAMLSLVLFSLAFGFATLFSPADVRTRVLSAANTLSSVMLVLIQGVLIVAPLGVFGLTVMVGAKLGGAAFSALGFYVAVSSSIMLAATVLLILLGIVAGRMPPRRYLAGAAPSMLIAAGTSSSLSSLPAMIEGALDQWRLRGEVVGFVLPLAASTFKFIAGASWVFNATFIAALYGMPLAPSGVLLIAVYAVLMNATIPGVPGGSLITISPVFVAIGLPMEGLAIILAVNPLVDRFGTVANVAANMAVAAIVARVTTGRA